MRSLDQERAEYAWKRVGPKPKGEYVNLAKAAPALIMHNGLMQALAFYKGKKHEALLGDLVVRLSKHVLGCKPEFDAVMGALHEARSSTYLRATDEALETLRWIRQYAAAREKAAEGAGGES